LIETVIAALLPIVVTLVLGFFAGWHHDFDASQGGVLNRMVMLYALPLTLFAGMMGMQRGEILAQGPMAAMLLVGMVGGYILVYVLAHYVFKRSQAAAALQALAIAGPAVPFVGVPVLGFLYGELSTIPVALGSLIMNLFQVPVTLFLLGRSADSSSNQAPGGGQNIMDNLKHTIKEPVVWAPILAFVLLLFDVHIPKDVRSSMQLLGGATGGVALFASGVILFSYHVKLNVPVLVSLVSKNIIVPLVILGLGLLIGIEVKTLDMSVVTLSIPTASICVILAVQYQTSEQEMASTLFLSTILSVLTMGGYLMYLN